MANNPPAHNQFRVWVTGARLPGPVPPDMITPHWDGAAVWHVMAYDARDAERKVRAMYGFPFTPRGCEFVRPADRASMPDDLMRYPYGTRLARWEGARQITGTVIESNPLHPCGITVAWDDGFTGQWDHRYLDAYTTVVMVGPEI